MLPSAWYLRPNKHETWERRPVTVFPFGANSLTKLAWPSTNGPSSNSMASFKITAPKRMNFRHPNNGTANLRDRHQMQPINISHPNPLAFITSLPPHSFDSKFYNQVNHQSSLCTLFTWKFFTLEFNYQSTMVRLEVSSNLLYFSLQSSSSLCDGFLIFHFVLSGCCSESQGSWNHRAGFSSSGP